MLKELVDSKLRVGRDQAIKRRDLVNICEAPDREVRLAIRELIKDGLPVASSSDRLHGGYYIANSPHEVTAYLEEIQTRIVELAKRRRDFKIASRSIKEQGQLPLI